MTRVILFDIDGTLVLTGGAGVRAMTRAFEDLFSISNAFASIPMPGRTDAGILSAAAVAHAIPVDSPGLTRFRHVYLTHLRNELDRPGPRKGVMLGIPSLLTALTERDDVYLALLTGNYEEAARAKLEYFGLWHYFGCGAFGDGAIERNGLLPRALEKVRQCGGPAASPAETIVIGDTPLDVACAVASGARSIAVATGSYDTEALRSTGADVVLQDLGDLQEVMKALKLRNGSVESSRDLSTD